MLIAKVCRSKTSFFNKSFTFTKLMSNFPYIQATNLCTVVPGNGINDSNNDKNDSKQIVPSENKDSFVQKVHNWDRNSTSLYEETMANAREMLKISVKMLNRKIEIDQLKI